MAIKMRMIFIVTIGLIDAFHHFTITYELFAGKIGYCLLFMCVSSISKDEQMSGREMCEKNIAAVTSVYVTTAIFQSNLSFYT